MSGDRRVVIATLQAGVGDLLYRGITVAPFRVHLQVAAVLPKRRTRERGIGENAPDFGQADAKARSLIAKTLRRSSDSRLLAEKVETEEDFVQAVADGYHYFQGYFFARPTIVRPRSPPGWRNRPRLSRRHCRPPSEPVWRRRWPPCHGFRRTRRPSLPSTKGRRPAA